ncbi:MAG: UbiD family decarboxylase [archaeon]
MNLRTFIKDLEKRDQLIKIKKEVSTRYEMAEILAALDGKPVLFEKVKGCDTKVIGNLYSSRDLVADAIATEKQDIIRSMAKAINNLKAPKVIEKAPCQEVIEKDVDLRKLPIMTYLKQDGGPYVPSAIAVIKDPGLGRNVCFHRLMVTGIDTFAARLVENRGTYNALKKSGGELEVAICIGNSAAVLLAAATSLKPGVDEFSLANALEKTDLVKCRTVDLEVPAESEIVLEGKITKETTDEGPFMDLTETLDKIRKQPVIKINCMTRRKDAIYQTLLPGLREHKILMGMPREPTIYDEVNKVVRCRNVLLTTGGNSWLHAVVQIEKKNADDGRKALDAAFRGHASLKHCIIVDDDIDIYDLNAVEGAIATRFQADKDAIIMPGAPGSSLDPSADLKDGEKAKTCKVGIDATIPFDKKDKSFKKTEYPKIDIEKYL